MRSAFVLLPMAGAAVVSARSSHGVLEGQVQAALQALRHGAGRDPVGGRWSLSGRRRESTTTTGLAQPPDPAQDNQ